jgi:antigen flippase
VLARVLGPTGRGQLASLFLWATLALDLALLGTRGSLTYHVAAYPDSRAGFVGVVAKSAIPTSAAAIVIFGGFVALGGRADSTSLPVLLLFALYTPIRIVVEQLLSLLQGEGRFPMFNAVRLIVVAFSASGFVLLAWAGRLSVGSAALVYVVATTSTAIAAFWVVPGSVVVPLSRLLRRSFWSFSIRNWLFVLSARGNTSVGLLVLTLVAFPAVVGEYAVATSVAATVPLVGVSVGIVALPRLAESRSSAERSSTFLRFFLFALTGTTVMSLGILGVVDWLIPTLFGTAFAASVPLAKVLVIGYFAVSMSAFSGNVLRGLNRPGVAAIAQFGGFSTTVLVVALAESVDASRVAVAAAVGFWATLVIESAVIAFVLKREASSFLREA